jgi:hypothetical protein
MGFDKEKQLALWIIYLIVTLGLSAGAFSMVLELSIPKFVLVQAAVVSSGSLFINHFKKWWEYV